MIKKQRINENKSGEISRLSFLSFDLSLAHFSLLAKGERSMRVGRNSRSLFAPPPRAALFPRGLSFYFFHEMEEALDAEPRLFVGQVRARREREGR